MAAALAMPSQPAVVGAVDIGGTKIAVGAIDVAGKVLAKEVRTTEVAAGFGAAMECVATMLESARARAGRSIDG
jgi:predicted NBD/HSP70 family sugar kinase